MIQTDRTFSAHGCSILVTCCFAEVFDVSIHTELQSCMTAFCEHTHTHISVSLVMRPFTLLHGRWMLSVTRTYCLEHRDWSKFQFNLHPFREGNLRVDTEPDLRAGLHCTGSRSFCEIANDWQGCDATHSAVRGCSTSIVGFEVIARDDIGVQERKASTVTTEPTALWSDLIATRPH